MASVPCLEMLPDEVLLQVCRYLTDADILYSLFNLNARLNATITRYCQHINLQGVPFERFQHVVTCVLPRIAPVVRSLVFQGSRERLLTPEMSTICYASMSKTFPQLQTITFYWLTVEQLQTFLERIQHLDQLVKLNIDSILDAGDENILAKVLAANNGRLQSVFCEANSTPFTVRTVTDEPVAVNIRTLRVPLADSSMLPHLFALVPNVRELSVSIGNQTSDFKDAQIFDGVVPLAHLVQFELLTLNQRWGLDEMSALLRHMPALQTLNFHVSTDDSRLIEHKHLSEALPHTIKQLHFFVYYFDEHCTVEFDTVALTDSWSSTFPIRCFLSEDGEVMLVLTTSCFGSTWLDLPVVFGKKFTSDCQYTQLVNDLFVSDAKSAADVLTTVKRFRGLRKLTIGALELDETKDDSKSSKQAISLSLPRLRELDVRDACFLPDVVNAAPNLIDLTINIACLKLLVDDSPTYALLQRRLVRLKVSLMTVGDYDDVQRFIQPFPHLRYLWLTLPNPTVSQDLLCSVLKQPNFEHLTAMSIPCGTCAGVASNLRQWVIDHSCLTANDLFAVILQDGYCVLWK